MPTQNEPIPAEAVDTCIKCNTPVRWIDCPTGGWWAHQDHPDDRHDAQTAADLMADRDWWKSTCEWWNESCIKAWQQRDSAAFSVRQLERELIDLRAENERLRAVAEASAVLTGDPDDPTWRTLSDALNALLDGVKLEQAIEPEAEKEH